MVQINQDAVVYTVPYEMLDFCLCRHNGYYDIPSLVQTDVYLYPKDYLLFCSVDGLDSVVFEVVCVYSPYCRAVDKRYFHIVAKTTSLKESDLGNLSTEPLYDLYMPPLSILSRLRGYPRPSLRLYLQSDELSFRSKLASFIEKALSIREEFYFVLSTDYSGRARDVTKHEEVYKANEANELFDRVQPDSAFEFEYNVYVVVGTTPVV